jgi:hypothetical protein
MDEKGKFLFLKCFSDEEQRKDEHTNFPSNKQKNIFEEFIIEFVKDSLSGYFEFSTKSVVYSTEKVVE